jgi:hypothetical protein
MSAWLDDLARVWVREMARRWALRIMLAVAAAGVLSDLRPTIASAVTCTATETLCQCPAIHGLFYKLCCPAGYTCSCIPPPEGAAICSPPPCPADRKCGGICCAEGETCADADLEYCCAAGQVPCTGGNTVTCCNSGDLCIAGTCCRALDACFTAASFPNACCPAPNVCTPEGTCCPAANTCLDECCVAGEVCNFGACCPAARVCGTTCCTPDQRCKHHKKKSVCKRYKKRKKHR